MSARVLYYHTELVTVHLVGLPPSGGCVMSTHPPHRLPQMDKEVECLSCLCKVGLGGCAESRGRGAM